MDEVAIRRRVIEALQDAMQSRRRGNEGRARVSARRAAGFAISLEAQRQDLSRAPQSAYKLLRWYAQREDLQPELRAAAQRLIARVGPDFRLPHREDPLQDAARIVTALLGEGALPPDWDGDGGAFHAGGHARQE